ncbi:nitric-oxide reductase large subunit [Acetobacteraceae bacterium]|nr:nitric-oxide reductase large subunit [Acetobacteraceae bacterium]
MDTSQIIGGDEKLSPWWRRILILTVVIASAALVYITAHTPEISPPIPEKVINVADNSVIATKEDIQDGQNIFQRYGLMDNGSLWGHGAYIGPDFGAAALHREAIILHEEYAQSEYKVAYKALDEGQRAAVNAEVATLLKKNEYNPQSGELHLTAAEAEAWKTSPDYWEDYVKDPSKDGGLKPNLITDKTELRKLAAYFDWAAWASIAQRPGQTHSYTNNFPYDPDAGNTPMPGAVLWSVLSALTLLGGIGGAIAVRDRYPGAGWVSNMQKQLPSRLVPGQATPAQRALGKYMLVAVTLFFLQTLMGGAIAHYRIDSASFYGIELYKIFPSNLLRAWHLQCAVFWVATAYVAGSLYMAIGLRPKGDELANSNLLKWMVNGLFAAFVVVVAGSFLGIWTGFLDLFKGSSDLWEWFGATGWEWLEQGKFWHFLLAVGLFGWFGMLFWLGRSSKNENKDDRALIRVFWLATLAVPLFYVPVLFIGHKTNYSMVEIWRFWLIHLWVEAYLEFFATTLVGVMFYMLGIVRVKTVLRTVYFDGILFFMGGVLGTCHHWYFTGQNQMMFAFGSLFSAMEVVPLTLMCAEAWDFFSATKRDTDGGYSVVHKYAFYFLVACGFWNFVGAGMCGFFINMPIMSYYEVGTMLTANHGHAAFMGVFGMLALAMVVLVLQNLSSKEEWVKLEKWIKVSLIGTNIGLALMCVTSLFPGGMFQLWDVMTNGYWHARSAAYTKTELALGIEWVRMFGDMIFILFGSLPAFIFALKAWVGLFSKKSKEIA